MPSSNKTLGNARRNKKDEFYTQLEDIENELRHYTQHFKGKVVFCNCDDPFESNFFKYFALNFNRLGLKKLICTCYAGSPIAQTQLSLFGDEIAYGDEIGGGQKPASQSLKTPYKAIVEVVRDTTGDGGIDLFDVAELFKTGENSLESLQGDGDFRSKECVELLKEADIVVTNPPFSMFREFLAQLTRYDKKFLIIGNQNAVTYKEVFPLIKNNRMWLGFGFRGNVGFFRSNYEDTASSTQHKEGFIRVSGVMWFTNLDHEKRHELMPLYKKYSPEEFPQYENYNAIEVSKTSDIPCDFAGEMGVPITFLDKYCPEQFEIVDISLSLAKPISQCVPPGSTYVKGGPAFYIDNGNGSYKRMYFRIVVRNKFPEV